MNLFEDQRVFMEACGQPTNVYNEKQFELYMELIREEYNELLDAENDVKVLDALMDILVVTIGAVHSLGVDGEAAWREVVRSNMSKVDVSSGKVLKRDDGKVLKPAGYSKPNFEQFFKK